jgi:beta-lactamase regulating signal transducer with metallopeptidase domain/HEAT repeat protein
MIITGIDTQLLATTLAKGTLLLIVAVGVAAALRRSPAGARHLVWLTTLATVLLFPLLARWQPVSFRVLPPIGENAGAPFTIEAPTSAGPSVSPSVAAPAIPERGPSLDREAAHSGPTLPEPATLLIVTWLAGAAALVGWLALGVFAVRRIVRGGRVLTDDRWTTPLYEVADRMNLDTVPRLIISERVEMPFACGIWRPTIVFPASADAWSDDRRRVVLFHELAHIKRRDLIGHALGRLACAVYWFHPLVWSAARHLRAESERACDDLVLACGAKASDYVAHLLDIITSVKHGGAPVTALPMARKKEFEGRMLAILDPAIPRGAPGRLQSAGILAVLVLITLSVSAAAPATREARNESLTAASDSLPEMQELDSPRPIEIERPEPQPKVAVVPTTKTQVTQETQTAVIEPEDEQEKAALAAEEIQDKVDALIRILRTDEDEEVRRSAAWGLAQMRDGRVSPALIDAFRKDKDEEVREMALWALVHLDPDPSIFIEALKQDKSVEVRETAAWALGNMDTHEGDAALISALKDEAPDVRRTATWALGQLRPRQAPAAIVSLLKDGDAEVRLMAAWALGQIVDPATAPALRAAFSAETDREARHAQFRALAFMGDMSNEFIDMAMKSPDPELRAKAVRVLAGQGTGAWPWPWPWPRPRPSP